MFGLFRRKPRVNADAVAAAIATLSDRPSTANRIALYRALKSGWLFLGAANMPSDWAAGPVGLEQATVVALLTSSNQEQGQALLAFTSRTEITKRNNHVGSFAMESRAVLELVVDKGFNALVINPQGPWAGIPKEDAQKILQGVW